MSMIRLASPIRYQEFNGYQAITKKIVNITIIALILVMVAMVFIYRDSLSALGALGYLGVFLISLISCATIFLPVPGLLLLMALGTVYNPVILGLVAALGGTLGEGVGYLLGARGRSLLPGGRIFEVSGKWMKRWGTTVVFLFSLIPLLPIDIISITAGSLHFQARKFFPACFLGKAILYSGMALASAWSAESIMAYFGL